MDIDKNTEKFNEYADRTQSVFNEVVFDYPDAEVIGFYCGQLGAALKALIAKNPSDEKRIIDFANFGFHSTMEKVKTQ